MRLFALVVLCLVAAPASAQDCGRLRPTFLHDRADEIRDYLRCLEAEIAGLRRDTARLQRALEEQARILATLPADYANIDGRVAAEPGRPVGRAVFALSSRRAEAAASLALDRGVVEALCARPGGCTIALAQQALGFGFGTPQVATAAGPCFFGYDPAGGAWFRGEGCGGPEVRGTDGDGAAPDAGGGEVIAAVAGCLLADADSGRKAAGAADLLARDTGPGLFLIAAPGGEDRFRCELTVE